MIRSYSYRSIAGIAVCALLSAPLGAQPRVRTGQASPPPGVGALAEHPNAGSAEKRDVGIWKPGGLVPPTSPMFVIYEEQVLTDSDLVPEDSTPQAAVYDPVSDRVLVGMRAGPPPHGMTRPFYWIDSTGDVTQGPSLPAGLRGADALAVVPTGPAAGVYMSAFDQLLRLDRASGTWTQVATIGPAGLAGFGGFLFWNPRTEELIACVRRRFEAFDPVTWTKRTGPMDTTFISPMAVYLPELDLLVNASDRVVDTSRSHWTLTTAFGTNRIVGASMTTSSRRGDPYFVNGWSSGLRQPQTWDFGIDPSSVAYGTSCNGPGGVFPAPVLRPFAPGMGLEPGEVSDLVVGDLLPLSSIALVVGGRRTAIDLTPFGIFGCTQLASLDLVLPPIQVFQPSATLPIALPDAPGLLGATFYLQVFENLATGVPRVFATNGLEVQVGLR